MDALIWSDRYVTGLRSVDGQHQTLVALINEFGELASRYAEVPRAQLEQVMDDLSKYALSHFVDEERLMNAAGVDARFARAHEQQHAHFLRDVNQMRAAQFLDAPDTTRVMMRFLLHWLAFHILGTDQQLARQMERITKGEAPAAAFDAEVHDVDGPAQLLLGALDDLLRTLAVRNRELTDANRTLEARVAERTAELQASNAQLQATVDALRATQTKLIDSEKLASVGQLASGLAHEINNPLAFISSNLSVLGEHATALLSVCTAVKTLAPTIPGPAGDELLQRLEAADVDFVQKDLGELLDETREGVTRVQTIVRDLKTFSHVDGGPVVDLDLKACVESALRILTMKGRTGITFTTTFPTVPRLRCHAAQVSQSLLNLVQNAVTAVREKGGGSVTITTGQDERFGWLEVKDTGVGMPPEVLGHAVEPFFTTRPPGQGVGLGLTTAYNCAQSHGGRLELHSVKGEGTTVRLLLPLEPAEKLTATRAPMSNDFNTRRYEGTASPPPR